MSARHQWPRASDVKQADALVVARALLNVAERLKRQELAEWAAELGLATRSRALTTEPTAGASRARSRSDRGSGLRRPTRNESSPPQSSLPW